MAFGWEPPKYAHLPAILGPDGKKKLSKRDGAISVQDYIKDGYLPQALISFLATLGWNDGTTQEIYTTNELISAFSLDRIQKSPAKFDAERLAWINGKLLRAMSLNELAEISKPFIGDIVGNSDLNYQKSVLTLVQERIKKLSELPELVDFFYNDPLILPIAELTKHYETAIAKQHLDAISKLLAAIENDRWNTQNIEQPIRQYVTDNELKAGQLFTIIRISTTGRTAAPGLFETLEVLGRETTLRRLDKAVKIV
jgi:glutamyl/glutaminyl-tRNA synthetase